MANTQQYVDLVQRISHLCAIYVMRFSTKLHCFVENDERKLMRAVAANKKTAAAAAKRAFNNEKEAAQSSQCFAHHCDSFLFLPLFWYCWCFFFFDFVFRLPVHTFLIALFLLTIKQWKMYNVDLRRQNTHDHEMKMHESMVYSTDERTKKKKSKSRSLTTVISWQTANTHALWRKKKTALIQNRQIFNERWNLWFALVSVCLSDYYFFSSISSGSPLCFQCECAFTLSSIFFFFVHSFVSISFQFICNENETSENWTGFFLSIWTLIKHIYRIVKTSDWIVRTIELMTMKVLSFIHFNHNSHLFQISRFNKTADGDIESKWNGSHSFLGLVNC